MFKKILAVTAIVLVIGVLIFGAVNRTLAQNSRESSGQGRHWSNAEENYLPTHQPDSGYDTGQGQGQGKGQSQGQGQGGQGTGSGGNASWSGAGLNAAVPGGQYNLPPATPGDLSDEETTALITMREEEKLAHDVYVMLYENWGLRVFQNISQSEQTHTDAVKALIDRYGLTDPASSKVGVFANPDLQALYNVLAARGSQSLAEALKVGAAIEEIDILDLQKDLAQTDKSDIQQVFNNLLNGSYNHLRAYVSNLSAETGETYQPQYMSAEAYQNIIGATTRGSGRGGGGGGYRGGRP
jgi:hypothetical protein